MEVLNEWEEKLLVLTYKKRDAKNKWDKADAAKRNAWTRCAKAQDAYYKAAGALSEHEEGH